MNVTCEYCHGVTDTGEGNCKNCGAPVTASPAAVDLHNCPFCGKRLLALGSPSCSYCGKRLPPDFIAAREADLHRVTAVSGGQSQPPTSQSIVIDVLNQASKPHSNSTGGVAEIITGILDIFSS